MYLSEPSQSSPLPSRPNGHDDSDKTTYERLLAAETAGANRDRSQKAADRAARKSLCPRHCPGLSVSLLIPRSHYRPNRLEYFDLSSSKVAGASSKEKAWPIPERQTRIHLHRVLPP